MQSAVASEAPRSLAQIVSTWPPHMLQKQAEEFSKRCKSVQTSFSGYDSYKGYFEPLLFAELAADLASAADKFCRSGKQRKSKYRIRREEPGTLLVEVIVKKAFPHKSFGWAVDLEPTDKNGPVGCGDSDVVALWCIGKQSKANAYSPNQKRIPPTAVLATVLRPTGKNGIRLTLTKFPDGSPSGQLDLEEGEESEVAPKPRLWYVLRLGSTVTIRREHEAVLNIKSSPLLSLLMKPAIEPANTRAPLAEPTAHSEKPESPAHGQEEAAVPPREHQFTEVVRQKMILNDSQTKAVFNSSTTTGGFAVIQGPPGTGKTRTLIALLNVIHMSQYQEYYEKIVANLRTLRPNGKQNAAQINVSNAEKTKMTGSKSTGVEGSLLESLVSAMHKTFASVNQGADKRHSTPARRPRILVCAPSNSAVDEVLARLIKLRLFDGQGHSYLPEVVRIGAGDRVNESAKPYTAEGQAEKFLNDVCSDDMNAEEQKLAQYNFLRVWQSDVNSLLLQLERTPKSESNMSNVIRFHEDLERADRSLRRLRISADSKLKRDEKLRKIARTIVEDANIVFSTLSGAASNILVSRDLQDNTALFDTVIIDEAAQSTEPSCLVPLMLGAKRCLLIGDPQQLPATVLSSGNAGNAYGQSLLDRMCRGGIKVLLLNKQYRMHPAISSFPRRHFYEGNLLDDETVQGNNRAKPYHRDVFKPRLGPYVFLDVADGEEERNEKNRSIFNRAEAELATIIYKKLKKDYASDGIFSAKGKAPGSTLGFGVVTPYKSQMQELRQAFDRAGVPTEDIEIDTVDSYQGREKDVIIFSCVRSAISRGIGFVRDVRRMNVGLTRARSSLIILGSARALAEGSEDWASLIEDAQSRGCLISVPEVERIFGSSSEPNQVKEDDESQKYAQATRDPRMRFQMKQDLRPAESLTHGSNHHQPPSLAAGRQEEIVPVPPHAVPTNLVPLNGGRLVRPELKELVDFMKTEGANLNEKTIAALEQHLAQGGELSQESFLAASIATGVCNIPLLDLNSEAVGGQAPNRDPSATMMNPTNVSATPGDVIPMNAANNASLPNIDPNSREQSELHLAPPGQVPPKNMPKPEENINTRPESLMHANGRNDATGWAMALGSNSGNVRNEFQGGADRDPGVNVDNAPTPFPLTGSGGRNQNGKRNADPSSGNGTSAYNSNSGSGHQVGHGHLHDDHESVMASRNRNTKRARYNGNQRQDQPTQYYNADFGNGYNEVPEQQGMMYDQGNQHFRQDGYHSNAMMPNVGMSNPYFPTNMPFPPPLPPGQPQGLSGPSAMQHSLIMQQLQQAAMHGMMQQPGSIHMPHPVAGPHGMQMPFIMPSNPPMPNMMPMPPPVYGGMNIPGLPGGVGVDNTQFNNHGRGGSWRGRGGGRYGRGRNQRGGRRRPG